MGHIHELNDFTAEIYIVYKDKVLLRLHDKYKVWFPCGGHVELDEDPNQAAVREAKEESGLDVTLIGKIPKRTLKDYSKQVKRLIPPMYMDMHSVSDTHNHISFVYFATTETDQLNPSGSDKSEDFKWLTKEELNSFEELAEKVKFYATKALEAVNEVEE